MSEIIETEVKEKEETKAPLCLVAKDGNYIFEDHMQLAAAASMCIQTKLAPQHLIDEGREAVMSALMFCKQFNLPQKAMSQMAYVKGRITPYGSLYTAIAQSHPLWGETNIVFFTDKMEEISLKNKNLDQEVYGCAVRVRAKGAENFNEYFFTLDDARKAKLYPAKDASAWTKYTKDMLWHKAKARAYSTEYASVLEGVEMYEDVKEALIDVTPKTREGGIADLLNEELEVG